MPLTSELGAMLAHVGQHGVTRAARDAAKPGFIDCVATTVAGQHEEPTRLLLSALAPLAQGHAQVLFGTQHASAAEAALINGVAAHTLDFDDVALRGHPSAVLVPAILAQAQELGSSGREMLDAYVAGYEVWAELVDRETDVHHLKGWHPTGIFGAIGAAAACAVLRRLDAGQCGHALGLGASQSAGLMSNFGSMAKPLHAGRAAQAGILAARLAAAGFTASIDALEHPQGFLAAVSPKGRVDRERPISWQGSNWQVDTRRTSIKRYPTCYFTHRSIDALLALSESAGITAPEVARIEVRISPEHATVLRNHRPQDALAAKFSIEFATAAALVAGNVGLTQLDDSFVQRADVQALMNKVHVAHSHEYDPEAPGWALTDQLTVTTMAGNVFAGEPTRHPHGHAQHPLTENELRGKVLDCLRYGRFAGDASEFYERLYSLEQLGARDICTGVF